MLRSFINRVRHFFIEIIIYTAAFILLIEDWLWDVSTRALGCLGALSLFRWMGTQIAALPPYAALATFILPFLLLLPVKLLALFALAKGHVAWGGAVIVAAKVGGTALTAKLYQITKPSLMTLGWLARLLTAFIAFKDRLIVLLKSTDAWQKFERARLLVRSRWISIGEGLRQRFAGNRLRRIIEKLHARRNTRS